jgi:hypothetical protein
MGVRKDARDGTEMRRKELEKNLKCILEVHSKSNCPFSLQCQTYLSLWERQSIQPTFAQCFMACDADLPQAVEPQLNQQGIGRREKRNLSPAKGHCQGTGLSKSDQGRRPPLTGPPLHPENRSK